MLDPILAPALGCLCSVLAALPVFPQDPPHAPAPRGERDVETPEIVVLGRVGQEGVPQVPFDAVGSRDILGPEEIQRVGARDLNDLVQYLPAVSTRPYNGGEAAAPSFSMRGLPDDGLTEYILTLIDGVPANPMPYGWTALSFFPLMTEQVYALDLIRGAHAVRYSPNTVGGVLNFITAPIPDEPAFGVQATAGDNDYRSALLSAGDGGDEPCGWRLTVGDRRGDGYRDDGEFDQQTVDLKLQWRHGPESWTATRATWFENSHKAPGGLTVAEFEQDRFANARPDNAFDGFRWLGEVVHHVGDDDDYAEVFGWVTQTRRELDAQRPHFGAPTELREWRDDTYVAAAGMRGSTDATFAGLEHELFWGVRAQQEWLPSYDIDAIPVGGGPTVDVQDSEYQLTALSAHLDDTIEPVERLKLSAGVRAEWVPRVEGEDEVLGGDFDDSFFGLLPGAGFSYELARTWVLYGNYHRGFRAPQVWGLNLAAGAMDQDVGFEHGESMELGTRVLAGGGVEAGIAAWRTDFDDVGVFYSGFYENIGRIVAEGVDLTLGWDAGEALEELEGFSLFASWTVQDSELREGPSEGNETPYAWEDKAAWSLQYLTEDQWRFSIGGVHVGESFSDEANTTIEPPEGNLGVNGSRTIWDGQVEKRWAGFAGGAFSLALGATNLLDDDWYVHSRGGFFGGGRVSGPPRQVYLRFGASF